MKKISWRRNGTDVRVDFGTRAQIVRGSLVLSRAMFEDSGRYTCIATTDYDEVRASAVIAVRGEENTFMQIRII